MSNTERGWGEGREERRPSQEGRAGGWWQSPLGPTALPPRKMAPTPAIEPGAGEGSFSLLQRVLPVQRLEQPGFSQLLFTCLDREMKHFIHSPPPSPQGRETPTKGRALPPFSAHPGLPQAQPGSGLCSAKPACWGHYWPHAPVLRKVDPAGCWLKDSERPSTVPSLGQLK